MRLRSLRPKITCLAVLLSCAFVQNALAAGFTALIAPPRFELRAEPGEVVRERVEISNPGDTPGSLLIRSVDWDMDENGTAVFHERELQPGSCRPWLRIERHKLRLPAKGKKRFRFELHVPEDAATGECRLALMVEAPPDEAVIADASGLNLPVRGRIAVVIYLAIGDARPELVIDDVVLGQHRGERTPVAIVTNHGNAHGRTGGFVDARDANGRRLEYEVTPLPVLPGQTRRVPFYQPGVDGEKSTPFVAPLELKGAVEWETGKQQIERRIE